ncbi:hypothetical protein CXB51_004075 [Gossypium anomalum]|uniref:SPX domain-containing protein n=1 Tax=Gossypium anomalum TaxID=47600 RepID=A0A8J5ZJ91_9ROSI|nr:hypothetical protein CXB51_004075 [Gossypium anomalum]
MKFGKEFEAQMVQEWQEAYVDYSNLKSILKDILRFKQLNNAPSPMAATIKGKLKRNASLYRAFSGLTSRFRPDSTLKNNEDEVILVSAVQKGDGEGDYQTMFLRSNEEGAEHELVFFRRLDDEFNKVIKFYKKNVAEVIVEADEIKVDNPVIGQNDVVNLVPNGFSSNSSSIDHPTNGGNQAWSMMNVIQEEQKKEDNDGINEGEGNKKEGFKAAPLEVLDHVKINVEVGTPLSTLKAVIRSSKSDLSFSRKELRTAEEKITRAIVEFYRKLRLLKSYCFLNQLAFSKIMKKYDKITSRNASKAYLQMVDKSYFGSSDEVTTLMERVEDTYAKHFANGNRRKGMKKLRPQAKRERHRITFLYGLFSGCSIALIVAIIVNLHARAVLKSVERDQYMVNIFPLYRYSYSNPVWLHSTAHAHVRWKHILLEALSNQLSIYIWFQARHRVGISTTPPPHFWSSLLTLAAAISHLDIEIDPRTQTFRTLTELIPLFLLILVVSIAFCPFNIIYRSSRFFLIRCAFRCVCAPLYKVTLPDFFLADQLTSQVQAFRSLEFYLCYYVWGNFRERSNKCEDSEVYRVFYIVVAIVPYWLRLIQCLRRLLEEKDAAHGVNGLKYLSTIAAVALRTIISFKSRRQQHGWSWRLQLLGWQPFLIHIGTLSSTGALNCVLRLVWMQQVLGIQTVLFLHGTVLTAVIASLEIIRRGIWNFFRLVNEHLNNVGKYRAFKSVPLPFCCDHNGDNSM